MRIDVGLVADEGVEDEGIGEFGRHFEIGGVVGCGLWILDGEGSESEGRGCGWVVGEVADVES